MNKYTTPGHQASTFSYMDRLHVVSAHETAVFSSSSYKIYKLRLK